MAYNRELADRIRGALAGKPSVREVRMFGGLSFMVDERMAIGANNNGDLLLRCDPGRADDLIAEKGARVAEMGNGRQMSKGWLAVRAEDIATEEDLEYWIGVALEYNEAAAAKGSKRSGRDRK